MVSNGPVTWMAECGECVRARCVRPRRLPTGQHCLHRAGGALCPGVPAGMAWVHLVTRAPVGVRRGERAAAVDASRPQTGRSATASPSACWAQAQARAAPLHVSRVSDACFGV